ncbi:MAG: DNA alkylation repair protein [Propionibacteriaceae bacterium]|nr:DNA alkylation repair protein [Propionibacteriaceae bacterium]
MSLIDEIRAGLAELADPVRAVSQQAYMKSSMPFLGVSVPVSRRVTVDLGTAHDPTLDQIIDAATTLWDEARFREERYAAQALLTLRPAVGAWEVIDLVEHMAVTGAWWDLVDEAAHRVADLLDRHPESTRPRVLIWSTHDDMWLRRLAIESQLQRRARTDTDLLTRVIEPNLADSRFFIRKAIGWALRDYAKADPDWVRDFVDTHDLSPLSRREALKHLS